MPVPIRNDGVDHRKRGRRVVLGVPVLGPDAGIRMTTKLRCAPCGFAQSRSAPRQWC